MYNNLTLKITPKYSYEKTKRNTQKSRVSINIRGSKERFGQHFTNFPTKATERSS
jgi:hypothetical protein